MKDIPPALAQHLASGTTTLAWCWRLTRRDGTRLGFTDHDRDIVFDGTTFEASAGFTASEVKDVLGLAVSNLQVDGALSSGRLDDADLAAGIFDEARVELYRVNWQDPAQRVLVRAGSLGEVKRTGAAFSAEVRGLAHYLQQPKGRLFQFTCDADVGDSRCKLALSGAGFTGTGSIAVATSERRFAVAGLGGYAPDWFTRGLLRFTSGAASGQAIEVKRYVVDDGQVTIELWAPARGPLVVGQSFVISAGCDKTYAMCQSRFANGVNFQGFPAMPGNDFVARRGRRGV